MGGTLGAERRELRAVVRSLLAEHCGEPEVRRLMATPEGYDPATWALLGALGAPGMAVPEPYGGGAGHIDLGIVLEEAGAVLLGAPLLSTVLAAEAVVRSGDEAARKDLLPRLAEQGAIGTVALLEGPGRWRAAPVDTRAEPTSDGWTLSGTKRHVLDGHTSDVVVVSALLEGTPALFAVEPPAAGLTVTPVPTLDRTRKQAHLTFARTPARLLAADATAALERVYATAEIQLATEQVGGAARALHLAVAYAGVRHQYGRAIGSFQALKHLCADVATAVETARSAAYAGLAALDADAPDLALTAAAAQVFCSETYTAAAGACIQVHGGIGFTWEHPAHLYLRRARSSEVLFGTPAQHRDRIARALGLS